jgi:hypothetical protein
VRVILVADANGRERHVGEEFDDFLEVEPVPTADTVDQWADRIRQHIRRLWVEDASSEKGVTVVLDAAVHYRVMLEHLQATMLREEKIKFLLAGA